MIPAASRSEPVGAPAQSIHRQLPESAINPDTD